MIIDKKLIIILIVLLCLLFFYFYRNISSNMEEFISNESPQYIKAKNTPFSKDFNLDDMCKNNNKKYLGWKCWWNDNQKNKINNQVDTGITTHATNEPLLFDGIKKI